MRLAPPPCEGGCDAVCTDQARRIVPAERAGLHVFVVTRLAGIARGIYCDSPASAMGVEVDGHVAYLADATRGLRVVVADPA